MSSSDVVPKPKRMPPWMSMPGAPPRPDHTAIGGKLTHLNDEKRKCFDELNKLREIINDSQKTPEEEEQEALRQKLSDIDGELRTQKALRVGKNTEITKLRQQSRDANKELKALQAELGGLSNVKEIDLAIEQVMRKMETSGGGLQAEKKTLRRLQQLEEAKGLFFKMQALSETIRDAEEREALLQKEYRDIYQRIGTLSREYEASLQVKHNKQKEVQMTGATRNELYKKSAEIRTRITEINKELDQIRAEHNKVTSAWNAWCDEAREKYNAKIQAELEELKRRQQEKIEAAKKKKEEYLSMKRRAMNEAEINACDSLVQYLREKKRITREEEAEQAKRNAAAAFDPKKAAPKGFTILNESKWASQKPLNQADKKQLKQQQKAAKANKPAAEKSLHHPRDMMGLFHSVGIEPPLSLLVIDDSIAKINEKKKEYESCVFTEEDLLSNGDKNTDEGEQEQGEQHHGAADAAQKEEAPEEKCEASE